MPEGVLPYPRWEGTLTPKSRIPVVVGNELRIALRNYWSLAALALGIAWGFASIIEFYNAAETATGAHSYAGFLAMHEQLLWFALGVAAALGGPALLEDARLGAPDLYLARSVTRGEYLAGKVLALVGLTTAVIFIPALVFWASSYVFYDARPEGWALAIFSSLAFALLWGIVVSGLALGFSSVARSASGAALLLFGGFAVLAYLVDPPALVQRVATITALTEDARWAILSPFAAMEAQQGWLFPVDAPHGFPYWWGLAYLGVLTLIGWGLLAWRHPRTRGAGRND